jgi:hypothetical protein
MKRGKQTLRRWCASAIGKTIELLRHLASWCRGQEEDEPVERAWELLIETGLQYYVAGRYAAFAALTPVLGNLLHHSVEMCCKGALAKLNPQKNTLNALMRLGHRLPRIWRELKNEANDPTLARFNNVIKRLHKFEDLRYPDAMLQQGMQSTVHILKSHVPSAGAGFGPTSKVPKYDLVVEEIDELIGAILAAASVNPQFFTRRAYRPEMREYLVKLNSVAFLTR